MNINKKYFSKNWWEETLIPRMRAYNYAIGFKQKVIEKTIEGEKLRFFIASPEAAAWYGDQSSDSSIEMKFVRDRMLRPGGTVLECGAHHGYGTIVLSRWTGDNGHVYACEPVDENVYVLKKNLEINELTNVHVMNVALGKETGHVCIRNKSNGMVETSNASRYATAELTTIDEICRQNDFKPDLIKIDVEGYELNVLRGSKETLLHHPALQIEVHPHQLWEFGDSSESLWSLVNLAAYEIWYQEHDLAEVVKLNKPPMIHRRSHVYLIPLISHFDNKFS